MNTFISPPTMGFDINVMMSLIMCEETGKPFYYGIDTKTGRLGRIYGLPTKEIPQELRTYLRGRGHIFHAYTQTFNLEDRFNVDVHEFLEHFPSWKAVQEHECYVEDDDSWTQDDHNAFRTLIDWCTKQHVEFRVSWSY